MYYLYVLRSLKDNKLYIGVTENIVRRVSEHNAGKNKSTRFRRPFILIYQKIFIEKGEAYKYEWFVKNTGKGNKALKQSISAEMAEP
ncbi:MAG: GIY-YIG nuclease family protein [bacterium]|nr:GIY-YIG nuclease family protein [bacterium]